MSQRGNSSIDFVPSVLCQQYQGLLNNDDVGNGRSIQVP